MERRLSGWVNEEDEAPCWESPSKAVRDFVGEERGLFSEHRREGQNSCVSLCLALRNSGLGK